MTQVATSCPSAAVKSISIHLDEDAGTDSVAALSRALAACPNVDRLSINLIPESRLSQPVATALGDWMDSRRFQYLRIFFKEDHVGECLEQILHGQVTAHVLDLVNQSSLYGRATPWRTLLSPSTCRALTHIHGVQDFTADCGIPRDHLDRSDLTRDWPLVKIASLPPDGCDTLSANLVALLQLHAETIMSLRIEDALDRGNLKTMAPLAERSLVLPRLTKLELVITVPVRSEPSATRCSTFLDLLHPNTPVEFLRYHLNTDSMTSLCDFIKSQTPPRLRRIEACVRARAERYLGNLPEEEQTAALRSLCEAKGIKLDDTNYVEYTR